MSEYYEITRKIEVLSEYGAAISAAYTRLAGNLEQTATDVWQLTDRLPLCETQEQLSEIEVGLDRLKTKLFEVYPDAVL